VDTKKKRERKMAEAIRSHIVAAVKRISESSWRGREHTAEEIAEDVKNFLDEEEEQLITETEWQEILDQFPIMDLSGKVFQIKDCFINRYGYGKETPASAEQPREVSAPQIEPSAEMIPAVDDPIIQEQALVNQLRNIRKQGVKKIVELYQQAFPGVTVAPGDKELVSFIRDNELEKKDNRRTVIVALQRIVGLEKIRRVFDVIEDKRPFDSKMELFEQWLKKQKGE
jgi:hypothetical protein